MGSWFFTRNYFCTKSCGFSIQTKPLRQNFCIVLLICDASILSWSFTKAHGTLDVLDAIVTFQGGADFEPTHRRHRPPSSLDFLRVETCTGRPRTHRAANNSNKKRLLRRRNKCDPMIVKKFSEKLKQLATKPRFLLVFWVDGDPYKAYGAHFTRH